MTLKELRDRIASVVVKDWPEVEGKLSSIEMRLVDVEIAGERYRVVPRRFSVRFWSSLDDHYLRSWNYRLTFYNPDTGKILKISGDDPAISRLSEAFYQLKED